MWYDFFTWHLQSLMIRRELAKDPKLSNENWDRFLPKFKKKNVKQKTPKPEKKKEEKSPFPPAQTPRKVDIQLETGEFWMKDKEKKAKKMEEKLQKQKEKTDAKRAEKEKAFIAPEEPRPSKSAALENGGSDAPSFDSLKEKLRQAIRLA
jgi:ribosomal RNA assembly protein